MQNRLNLYPTTTIMSGTELAACLGRASMPDGSSLLSWRILEIVSMVFEE
jgi:hypothetical protein